MQAILIAVGVTVVAVIVVAPVGLAWWCISVTLSQAAVMDQFEDFDRNMQ